MICSFFHQLLLISDKELSRVDYMSFQELIGGESPDTSSNPLNQA